MKANRAASLLRMRARLVAQYQELLAMQSEEASVQQTIRYMNRRIRLKGMIAGLEERLRQGGYRWPGEETTDES